MSEDLRKSVHFHETDPGREWVKDPGVAIEAESPDEGPLMVTPNVIQTADGRFRMYFTSLRYGTHAFVDSTASILSAISDDGLKWEREPGVRLAPFSPEGTLRVLCPDVIPLVEGGYRMYLEASVTPDEPCWIVSAVSADGLSFEPEPGVRYGDGQGKYGSPRCVFTDDKAARYRLYFHSHPLPVEPGSKRFIASAVSDDGLRFTRERGVRIAQDNEFESGTVYAPEVVRLGGGSYRMYYAAWTLDPTNGRILSAHSSDGLAWTKDEGPCIDIGGKYDKIKASEPCVISLPDGRSRLYYEASDEHGQRRMLSATSLAVS